LDIVIARLVHIFAGTFWIGAGTLSILIIHPYGKKILQQGDRAIEAFYSKSNWSRYLAINAVLTVLAGLYLYFRLSDGFTLSWLSQAGMTVLAIGSVAGVLCMIHGGAFVGRLQGQMGKFAAQIQDNPTSEQRSQLATMTKTLEMHTYINFGLALIAVIGMASARHIHLL